MTDNTMEDILVSSMSGWPETTTGSPSGITAKPKGDKTTYAFAIPPKIVGVLGSISVIGTRDTVGIYIAGQNLATGEAALWVGNHTDADELIAAIINVTGHDPDDDVLNERDQNGEWADRLANAVASKLGVDIGEHSNTNNPWRQALDALDALPDA